jgi:UPF0042 nucleotide-binding protein
MRQLTGLDGAVCRHVLKTPGARDLIASITEQAVVAAKRRPVRVLIGCQGGRHRSVVVALEVAKLARLFGVPADVTHHHVTQPVIR